jgi:alpha-amylase
VLMHRKKIIETFGLVPKVLSNTELAYNNDLARWADDAGYKGIIAEGWDGVLEWRSPNFVYTPQGTRFIKLLLKNYRLSDDLAFRFSERSWEGWPLTAEKFAHWISAVNGDGQTVNLFMDYETFGEHQWAETGIFHFLRALPGEMYKHADNQFLLPSEVIDSYSAVGEVDVPHILTWADTDRDLSAWTGNDMQRAMLGAVYKLEEDILASRNEELIADWRKLQTSDHFYYMCTKWFADGDVHAYFSPYSSPYDAFIAFNNILQDVKLRVHATGANTC